MGRSFFKNNLSSSAQRHSSGKKNAAPVPPDGTVRAEEAGTSPVPPETPCREPSADGTVRKDEEQTVPASPPEPPPKPPPEIYDDDTVCRLLRIRRSVVAGARTSKTRGRDWDAVGLHVGMTRDWIDRYALAHGTVPQYLTVGAKPVQPNDGCVSCVLVQTFPNPSKVTVEIVATGRREIATVRNMYQHPMRLRQAFDCVRTLGDRLEWTARWNNSPW